MTPVQEAVFAAAPAEWEPLPTNVHRGVLKALQSAKLIEIAHFPLRWRRKPGASPERAMKHRSKFDAFMDAIRSARKRAGKKDRECELSLEVARQLWTRCRGRCELTGIPFSLDRKEEHRWRAYAPSIDRLDSSRGYTEDNVRVVCTAVNLAMNQWGEDVLRRIAAGLLRQRFGPTIVPEGENRDDQHTLSG